RPGEEDRGSGAVASAVRRTTRRHAEQVCAGEKERPKFLRQSLGHADGTLVVTRHDVPWSAAARGRFGELGQRLRHPERNNAAGNAGRDWQAVAVERQGHAAATWSTQCSPREPYWFYRKQSSASGSVATVCGPSCACSCSSSASWVISGRKLSRILMRTGRA